MKKILILADSRGMWPREYNWPTVLGQKLGGDYQISTHISGVDAWLISINGMEQFLLDTYPDEKFDVIIVQSGWHEGGPCYWPEDIWEKIITTKTRTFDSKH